MNDNLVTVLARKSLPRDTVSSVIVREDLEISVAVKEELIFLDANSRDQLTFTDLKNNFLPNSTIQQVSLAEDVHSKNLELCCYGDSTAFRLKLVKDVPSRDELELWFSEDLLAQLGMPFLTPANIKDRKNYVCHRCSFQFEKPNPLKIHLFLNCHKFNSRLFWNKFLERIYDNSTPLNLSLSNMRPRSQECFQSSTQSTEFRCYSEPPFSAFRPILPRNFSQLFYPNLSIRQSLKQVDLAKSLNNISLANPVEIETFATNWGKSREGHICLYCGRVYSRKYGLKIHIRTHTGYKPLQCKFCFRPFGDPSNLNKHVRLHAQCETPYACNVCGKMLVRKRDLDRHVKTRHCDVNSSSH